jgi:alpha-L-fucosidase
MTVSRKNQWAWGGGGDGVKSFRQCLEMLIGCAGGDGNLLFNIGPTPTGEIAPEQCERLTELGAWLAKYGESIHGTRGGPFKPGRYGVSTRKGNTIYLHVFEGMEDMVRLPPLPAKISSNRILSGGTASVRQSGQGIDVSVGEKAKQPMVTVVALELDHPALQLAALDVPEPRSITAQARVTASNIYKNQREFGPAKAIDGRRDTRWATDAGISSAYLELDFPTPVTFQRARLSEAFPNRVQRFELQWLDGGNWKAVVTGTTIGDAWSRTFAPVTAQKVRLVILESTDGPTINEFELLEN